MPAGPMQYGAYNNAGGDETSLDSNSLNTSAFTVYGGKRGVEAYQSQDYAYPANQNVSAVMGVALGNVAAGVFGWAFNGRGIWGKCVQDTGYAGVFEGNVRVTGQLDKAGGGFRIDHPDDPENRYLSHSFVESAERLNLYSGIITTDRDCSATVHLPSYFDSLNRDFTYQLTVMGQFAQAIIEEEIRDSRFRVKTDAPNVSVSWLVTGIRQDAWANANPMVLENDKAEEERGKYLHPEAHGQPRERGMNFELDQEIEQRNRERRDSTSGADGRK